MVDVVAPGFRCSNEELEGAKNYLSSLGLVPRVPKDLFKGRSLFSNSDDYRFKHLAYALRAPDSKAVWCIRGGYGSIRLLPELRKLKRPKLQKVFLGYSDITTIHSFLNQFWGWTTLHSPVLDRFGGGRFKPIEYRELRQILFGDVQKLEFKNLRPLNSRAQKKSTVKAKMVGGNLAVLQSSIGTPFEIDLKNKILFLEDVGERPHRMDRMLVHLTQAGVLKGAKGIIFGDLVLRDDRERKQIWSQVVSEFARLQKIPVFKGLPAGHGAIQRTLPFNTNAVLSGGEKGSLLVETGGQA